MLSLSKTTAYLCRVFQGLPQANTLPEIEELLPWRINKEVHATDWEAKEAA
jgi:hypothetical protein